MTTKAFTNWTGKDRHLTRDEYIQEWLDQTETFKGIFAFYSNTNHMQDFMEELKRIAGIQWDQSK